MAYGARLESVLGESPRGFESPILRQKPLLRLSILFPDHVLTATIFSGNLPSVGHSELANFPIIGLSPCSTKPSVSALTSSLSFVKGGMYAGPWTNFETHSRALAPKGPNDWHAGE